MDYRVEVGTDGTVRGKVWVTIVRTGRVSELHFDAGSWDDVQRLIYAASQMKTKEQSGIQRLS